MKRALLILALAATGHAQLFRVDPPPVTTTAGNVSPGGYPTLYAVPGATITVCADAACATPATTYQPNGTACPSYAQVVLPGSAACTTAAGAQGQFGFWLASGTYYYQVSLPSGPTYGNYPITTNTLVAGVASVTAGTGISVSASTGNIVITNTGSGVSSFGPGLV